MGRGEGGGGSVVVSFVKFVCFELLIMGLFLYLYCVSIGCYFYLLVSFSFSLLFFLLLLSIHHLFIYLLPARERRMGRGGSLPIFFLISRMIIFFF